MSLGQAFVEARADTKDFARDLQRDLKAILKALPPFRVKIEADLSQLRTQLAEATRAQAIEITVTADTAALREQLAAATRDRAVRVAVFANTDLLREQLADVTHDRAVLINVVADVDALRAQLTDVTRDRAITIRVTADAKALKAELAKATKTEPVKISFVAQKIASLRAQIQRELRALPAIDVKIQPGSLATFRQQVREGTKTAPIIIKVIADTKALKAELAKATKADPVQIGLEVNRKGFAAELKRAVKSALEEVNPAFVKLAVDPRGFTRDVKKFVKLALEEVNPAFVKLAVDPRGFAREVKRIVKLALEEVNPAFIKLAVDPRGLARDLRKFVRLALETVNPAYIKLAVDPRGFIVDLRRAVRDAQLAVGPIRVRVVVDQSSLNSVVGSASSVARRTEKIFGNLGTKIADSLKSAAKVGGLALAGVAAVGEGAFIAIGTAGIKAAADLQLVNLSLENLAKGTESAAKAGRVLAKDTLFGRVTKDAADFNQELVGLQNRIKQFAIASPLGFNDVADSVIRLTSALDVTGDQALKQIDAISGALAISPTGLNAEGLKGVVTALTQIAAAGKLGGQELLQLSNRLPALSRPEIFLNIAKGLIGTKDAIKGVKEDTIKLSAVQLTEAKKLQKAGAISSDLALNAIFRTLKEAPGAEDALKAFTNTFTGQMQRIKETLQLNIGTAFLPILTKVGDGLEKLAIKISDVFNSDIGKNFIKSFGEQFQTVIDGFVTALPSILEGITSIGNSFTNLFKQIGPDGFKSIFDGIKSIFDFISATIKTIAPVIGGIISAIKQAAPAFQPFLVAVGKLAVSFGGFLKDVGGPVLQILGKTLSALAPVIEIIAGALAVVGKILGAILSNGFVQWILSVIGSFLLLGGAIAGATAKITEVGAAIGTFVTRALSGLGTSITRIATNFRIFQLIGARAFQVVAQAVGFLRNIIVGLYPPLQAIGRFFNVVIGTIRIFATAALGSLRTVFNFLSRFIPTFKLISLAVGALGIAFSSIGNAVKEGFGKALDFVLAAMQKIFELAGHLPFIGGKFDGLADKVAQLRGELNAIPTDVVSNVAVHITVTEAFKQAEKASPGASISTGNQGGLFGTGGAGVFISSEQQKEVKDQATTFGIDSGKAIADSVGGGIKSGAEKAADTAKEGFKDFRKKLADELRYTKEYVADLVAKDGAGIRDQLRALSKEIADAFDAAGKPRPSKLLALIDADNKALQKLADKRAAIVDRLKAAEERARSVISGVKEFANIAGLTLDDVASSVKKAADTSKTIERSTLDLAGSFQVTRKVLKNAATGVDDATKAATRALTGKDFLNVLKSRLDAIKKFNADIAALRKRGLSREILNELISAGVETGGATAAQLRNSSGATIKAINATQQGIDKAAKKLGDQAALVQDELNKRFASAGEFAAKGFVTGLQKQEKALLAEMTKLGNKLVAAIKKALGIHSPSTEFAEVAHFSVEGLLQTFQARIPHLQAMANKVARAALPTIDSASVDAQFDRVRQAVDIQGQKIGMDASLTHQVEANVGGRDIAMIERLSAIEKAVHKNTEATKGAPRTTIHAPQTVHVAAAPKPGNLLKTIVRGL